MRYSLIALILLALSALPGRAQVNIQPQQEIADYKQLYRDYPLAVSPNEQATLRDLTFQKLTVDYWNDFKRFLRKKNFRTDTTIALYIEGFYQPTGRTDRLLYRYMVENQKPPVRKEQALLTLLADYCNQYPLPVTSTLVWSPFRISSSLILAAPSVRKVPRGPGVIGDIASARQTTRPDTVNVVSFSGLDLEQIPDVIYRFVNVKEINLNNNYLTSLPAQLTALPRLQRLTLMSNRLQEDSVFFSRNNHLKAVTLQKNSLTQLPGSIRQNRRLESLWLGNNNLAAIDVKLLRKLHRLTDLNLYNAGLTSIPKGIGRLKHVKVLDIYYNKITELPRQIGRMKRLEQLAISYNDLSTLPASLSKLHQLQQLFAHHNRISQLPDHFERLVNLRVLDLANNWITVIPPSLNALPVLEDLNLGTNNIQELPAFLSGMTNLKKLFLRGNPITQTDAIAGPYAPVIKIMETNRTEVFY